MKIESIIFDLDGTLLDTLEDLADSVNELLDKNNLPIHPVDSYKKFIGDGVENLLKKALPENYQNDNNIKKFLNEYKSIYKKNCFNKTKPYSGIIKLLDFLKNRNIKLSIFSNKPDNFTQIITKKYFKNIRFDFIFGAKECQPIKPDPYVPIMIAKNLKIKTENFLYLGDSGVDMQTAINAGMFPVGALWGFRSKEELILNGAKILINAPLELIKHL